LLKYLEYRDGRDDYDPANRDRWVDGGLGTHYRDILKRLDDLGQANPHAYCFSLVISPDPEALARVQEENRQVQFVEVVKAALAEWDIWRAEHDKSPQAGPIEYAFVVHRPEREYGEQMHAHVVIGAGTEDPATGDRTALYNNRPHIDAFKEIAERQLDRMFDLERDREQPGLEREQAEPERGLYSIEREISFHGDR
jgi:hypothetical protein